MSSKSSICSLPFWTSHLRRPLSPISSVFALNSLFRSHRCFRKVSARSSSNSAKIEILDQIRTTTYILRASHKNSSCIGRRELAILLSLRARLRHCFNRCEVWPGRPATARSVFSNCELPHQRSCCYCQQTWSYLQIDAGCCSYRNPFIILSTPEHDLPLLPYLG